MPANSSSGEFVPTREIIELLRNRNILQRDVKGRLNMSYNTLIKGLDNPLIFRLHQIISLAKALEITPAQLTTYFVGQAQQRGLPQPASPTEEA